MSPVVYLLVRSVWASPGAHMVKNPPAVLETCVRSRAWEDPLEKGMAAHSSILAQSIPMDRGPQRVRRF